jgi:hypothetical protein
MVVFNIFVVSDGVGISSFAFERDEVAALFLPHNDIMGMPKY